MLGGSVNSDCGLERGRKVCVSPRRSSFPLSLVVHTFSEELAAQGSSRSTPARLCRNNALCATALPNVLMVRFGIERGHPPAPNGVARIAPQHPLIPAAPA